jgi:tetratricopeptide (TPR) repeat protein
MPDFGGELRRLLGESDVSLRELARRAHCDPGHLSKVANGIKPASPRLAASLDEALGAGGQLRAAAVEPVSGMRRNRAERSWLARGAVTLSDVDAIAEITQTFRGLDNKFGGGHAHMLAAEYLESTVVSMLREGTYSEELGQRLFGVAAQLAHLVGWTAYDMDNHGRAREYFTKALELAAAGHHVFGGEILAARSHHAIHLGDPIKAAELARAARQSASKTAIPALLAEAYALEANSHALLGDVRAYTSALLEAERAFRKSGAANTPGWLRYFDEGYLAARFAHSFRELGQWDEARKHALQAVKMSENMARTRAFNMAVLATTYIETDLDQACDVASQATDLAAGLQSRRIIRYIGDVRKRLLRRHGNKPAVINFCEYASATLGVG